jgi:hypothetical protein
MRRARKKNPGLFGSKEYFLRARSKRGTGPEMYFTGNRFTDSGRAKGFKLWWSAMRTLHRLAREYPVLKGYALSVIGPNGVTLVNPKKRSKQGIVRAAKLLKDFSGHPASEVVSVNEKDFTTGLAIGPVLGLAYQTVRDGRTEDYMHEFRKSSQPLLAVSSDGKHLRVVGGRFQFTAAGIEDR